MNLTGMDFKSAGQLGDGLFPRKGGQGHLGLERRTVLIPRQEIEHLKRENYDLKQLVADLSLEVHRFKKTVIPTLDEGTGT